jgi:hypothetical protein
VVLREVGIVLDVLEELRGKPREERAAQRVLLSLISALGLED